MVHELLLIGGFACAVVGMAISVWGLRDEMKRKKRK